MRDVMSKAGAQPSRSPPGTGIALLVLNWNGADLLRRHLPAVVEAAARATATTSVHVIDNASSDSSCEVVNQFEGVNLISRPTNRRLHAYNDVVPGLDCEAFMMLNNDLSPSANTVDALWSVMNDHPDVFMAGGEVLDVGSGEVESGPTGARWDRQWLLEARALKGARQPVDVAYVSAGAGLCRRSMFLELGGFWEALPALYWEDVEMGLRAWMHGWRSVYHPAVHSRHESGTTIRRTISPAGRTIGSYRNNRLTHLGLTLDRADLRDYLRGELLRALRRPYLWPAALTLLPQARALARHRRALRARCGSVQVSTLERHWYVGTVGESV
jgi:GT2 family glycosyltransferase